MQGETTMLACKIRTEIQINGYLELKDLPFREGTQIEIVISEKKPTESLKRLIGNDHVWSAEDIQRVASGREILNQWKIS